MLNPLRGNATIASALQSLPAFNFAAFRRTAAWGSAAFIALVAVIYTAESDRGAERLQQAFGGRGEPAAARPVVAFIPPGNPDLDKINRRLTETVQTLAAERDKLNERLAGLERHLEDITGSIKKPPQPVKDKLITDASPAVPVAPMMIFTGIPPVPPRSPALWPAVDPPATVPAQGAIPEAQVVPLPPVRADRDTTGSVPDADTAPHGAATTIANAMAPEPRQQVFGVDLGGARSIDALTIHWQSLRVKHGAALNDLQAVVSIRERRPGVPELRLVAGPLPNEEAVTKLCMTLIAARAPCHPAVFSGQRLVLR